jgi:hypothetical protein
MIPKEKENEKSGSGLSMSSEEITTKTKKSHPANFIKPCNIYHQNIGGLRGKTDKLLSQLHPVFPHVLCFMEHHMNHVELQQTYVEHCVQKEVCAPMCIKV